MKAEISMQLYRYPYQNKHSFSPALAISLTQINNISCFIVINLFNQCYNLLFRIKSWLVNTENEIEKFENPFSLVDIVQSDKLSEICKVRK